MLPATFTTLSDGSLLISHPETQSRKLAACRRSISANIRGRRLQVFVGADGQLWYYNNYQDAEYFDENFGQVIVASDPESCIRWLRSYTPRGPEQDRLLEYYINLHFPTFWEQRTEYRLKDFEHWEEEQKAAAIRWYQLEEARLNAEAAALEELSTGNYDGNHECDTLESEP